MSVHTSNVQVKNRKAILGEFCGKVYQLHCSIIRESNFWNFVSLNKFASGSISSSRRTSFVEKRLAFIFFNFFSSLTLFVCIAYERLDLKMSDLVVTFSNYRQCYLEIFFLLISPSRRKALHIYLYLSICLLFPDFLPLWLTPLLKNLRL